MRIAGRQQNFHDLLLCLLAGKGEDPWSVFSILINGLGSMAKAWNYEGEQLLRACKDVDYTIVSAPFRTRPVLCTASLLSG
jgi:hypothetical protein